MHKVHLSCEVTAEKRNLFCNASLLLILRSEGKPSLLHQRGMFLYYLKLAASKCRSTAMQENCHFLVNTNVTEAIPTYTFRLWTERFA